jgi:hypothetical protein
MTGTEPYILSKNGLQTANTLLFIHIINELGFLFWAQLKNKSLVNYFTRLLFLAGDIIMRGRLRQTPLEQHRYF